MARPSREIAILDAALRCFAERGYSGTRTKTIAERAGVSEAALYRHFRSKEDLARRLYAQTLETYSGLLEQAAGGGGPCEQQLRQCLRAGLSLFRANRDAMTFAILRQQEFMPDLPPDFRYPIQILADLLVEGQQQGAVRAGDPKLLAAIFSGCLLRPLIVFQLAAAGSFDLEHDMSHDRLLEDAAWAAVRS